MFKLLVKSIKHYGYQIVVHIMMKPGKISLDPVCRNMAICCASLWGRDNNCFFSSSLCSINTGVSVIQPCKAISLSLKCFSPFSTAGFFLPGLSSNVTSSEAFSSFLSTIFPNRSHLHCSFLYSSSHCRPLSCFMNSFTCLSPLTRM